MCCIRIRNDIFKVVYHTISARTSCLAAKGGLMLSGLNVVLVQS